MREVQAQLIKAGHTITHDWTAESEVKCEQDWINHAALDRNGVAQADAFVGVFEKDLAYCGALSEMGMAAARCIPIYILGNAVDRNVFTHLPEVRRGIEELLDERVLSMP